jgi:hypothetical protein
MPKDTPCHNWQTLNREFHEPEDLHQEDLAAEVRLAICALSDANLRRLAYAIDNGDYQGAGRIIQSGFEHLAGI